jgi:hypothetical protein
MQFQKGQSGNPAGRPRGARGKATMFAQNLIEGDVAALVTTAIDLAKKGDMGALRLCLNQLLPARKHAPVACDFPPIDKPADAVAAMAAIASSVAAGDLAPGEAAELAKVVDFSVKAIYAHDFDQRLTEVEKRGAQRHGGIKSGDALLTSGAGRAT